MFRGACGSLFISLTFFATVVAGSITKTWITNLIFLGRDSVHKSSVNENGDAGAGGSKFELVGENT